MDGIVVACDMDEPTDRSPPSTLATPPTHARVSLGPQSTVSILGPQSTVSILAVLF